MVLRSREISYEHANVSIDTASKLVADDKGLLAMDESNPTCNKRFAKLNIPQTVEARRAYRELIVTTPGLGESISGVILYDETIRQKKTDGTPFLKILADAGIIPGIKVDTGAKDMAAHPGEKITEGLDGLRDRLKEYFQMGARFAKWRAVIAIGEGIPSRSCIEANAHALARYAALCQEAGLVPIVEPEVLMDGGHTLERCREVTEEVLRTFSSSSIRQRVLLEGMILKPNMVLPGLTCPPHKEVKEVGIGEQQYQVRLTDRQPDEEQDIDEVANITVKSLWRTVPAAVPGIAFSIRRPIRRTGLGPFECDESAIQVATAVGAVIFVCPRHPAAGFGDLARPGGQRKSGTASAASSRQSATGPRAVANTPPRWKRHKHDNTGQRASDLAGEKPSFHQDESR
jgi:fructose-bisphosphate aldolase class I